jgi:CCR4-NOT transcription complex subunit 6
VALIAVLEALEPPFADSGGASGAASRRQLICVANTHIHSNPELNDVKLWQVGRGCTQSSKSGSRRGA